MSEASIPCVPARRTLRLARYAALAVIVISVAALAGWATGNHALKGLFAGAVEMKANAAVGMILIASGLFLLAYRPLSEARGEAGRRRLATCCGAAAMLLGLATLCEHLTGWDFHLDQLLFQDPLGADAPGTVRLPGRMSPCTAWNFICLGFALMILAGRRRPRVVEWLIAAAAFPTGVLMLGAFYGVLIFFSNTFYAAIAVQTAVCLVCLCVGLMALNAGGPVRGALRESSARGRMLRRLCPAGIVLPMLIGWARIWGRRHGYIGLDTWVVIVAVANMVSFTTLAWWSARILRTGELIIGETKGALHASQANYEFMANAMPQMVWTSRADGVTEYVNAALQRFSGLHLAGEMDAGWESALHPDDLRTSIDRWTRSIETGENYECEQRFRRASDGVYRWHLSRALPQRDEAGNIVQWVGTSTDIDDQKRAVDALRESEDRVQLVFENLTEGLLIADLDGNNLRWNRAGLELHEFENAAEAMATMADCARRFEVATLEGEVLPLEQWPFLRITRGEKVRGVEMRVRRRDKDWERILSYSGSIVRDAAGKQWVFVTIADISERHRANAALLELNGTLEHKVAERTAELEEAKEEAEAANRAKSSFLANMSHEIRTPMNAVMGMTNLLLDTKLSPEQHDFAETVRSSSEHLLNIINDILDFSKVEAGKMTFECIDFELREVVASTVELLSGGARRKGLVLAVVIDPNVPRLLRGDASRLRQVLLNLTGNALKFTSQGQVTVGVSLVSETPGSATIEFQVRDTGIGVAPDALKRLFQTFSQADVSTTRKYGGTGLGLAISKQLVELMSGTMSVESVVGEGTTMRFTLEFPKHMALPLPALALPASAAPVISPPVATPSVRPGVAAPRSERVLVVEDNLINQKVVMGQLRRLGYTADLANNGLEMLEAVRLKTYDIVLMDCLMPEMDGYTAAATCRQLYPSTNKPWIIAVTANAMSGAREACLAAGMNDYVSKPVRIKDLEEALDRARRQAAEKSPGAPPSGFRPELAALAAHTALEADMRQERAATSG